jgi:hypothetical protein
MTTDLSARTSTMLDAYFDTGDIHGCICHPIDTW